MEVSGGKGMVIFQNQKGFALPLVLIIVLVISLLGTTLYQYSTSDTLRVAENEKSMQAYYLARSGASAVASYIVNNPDGLSSEEMNQLIDDLTAATESGAVRLSNDLNGTFKVKVSRDVENGVIYIQSTGYIGDFTGSPVTITIREHVIPGEPGGASIVPPAFDSAVFANNSIKLSGSASISGPAGINISQEDCVTLNGNPRIYSNLYIGPGVNPGEAIKTPQWEDVSYFITGEIIPRDTVRKYKLPPFPEFPDLPERGSFEAGWWPSPPYYIDQDGSYSEIDVKSKLVIKVGDGVRNIRVGSLKVSGSGEIVLEGSGKLNLYVEDTFDLSGSGTINENGNPDSLIMYYQGKHEIAPSGDTEFVGSVYAKSANVALKGSGSIQGNVITGGKSVTLAGASSAFVRAIYAPKAKVELDGSSQIKGAIVAGEFEAVGAARVEYNTNLSFPFSNEDLVESTKTPDLPDAIDYRIGLWS